MDLENSVQNEQPGTEAEELQKNAEVAAIEQEAAAEEASAVEEKKAEEEVDAEISAAYSAKSKEELLRELEELIGQKPADSIKASVDAIKIAFYKKHKSEIEAERSAFLASGGKEEEFAPATDDNEKRLKELLADYRTKRGAITKEIEAEQAKNLEAKQAIIEKLKSLAEEGSGDIAAFEEFKRLQQAWNSTGPVDRSKLNDLWRTYHFYVESFYNILKVNRELRDLDLKKNFEAKNELCAEAESLILDPQVVESFHKLQELHDRWREIGPVPNELKEEQWTRFKSASAIINKRHQDFFEGIKKEQLSNLNLKRELCDKVRLILEEGADSPRKWEEQSQKVMEIQKMWRTIGFAPKKENTRIYEEFRRLCNEFFAHKHEYFGSLKGQHSEVLQKKKDICGRAAQLEMSENWGATTAAILELQKEWKELGGGPRKESDALWARFRASCDTFFGRKSEHFKEQDERYADNLKAKLSIIEELKNFDAEDPREALEKLKEVQNRWGEIGFIAFKMKDKVQGEYRELINALFKRFKLTQGEQKLEKFRSKVKSNTGAGRGFSRERDRLVAQMRELENDIMLWENNIGFFAKSKNAEALISDVERKIERAKEDMALLKEKITIIDNQ